MINKPKTSFFKSLRFRILIILIILGIVPSVIVTQIVINTYADRAIAPVSYTHLTLPTKA